MQGSYGSVAFFRVGQSNKRALILENRSGMQAEKKKMVVI
jgi:hypothetical protein